MKPNPFDTQTSVLSSQTLAHLIHSRYQLKAPVTCEFFLAGVTHTYRVHTHTKTYYLRIYRSGWRTKKEIESECTILQKLYQSGIAVALPVQRKNGLYLNRISATEGTRYAILFQNAPGLPIDIHNLQTCYRFGQTVAKMHRSLDQVPTRYTRPTFDLNYLIDRSIQLLQPFLIDRPKDFAFLTQTGCQIKMNLQQLPKSSPIFGLCHGDIQPKNAHDINGQITFFDFDNCNYTYRLFDLCGFLYQNLDKNPECNRAFISGYENTRHLSNKEKAAMKDFLAAFYIWGLGFTAEINTAISGRQIFDRIFDRVFKSFRDFLHTKQSFY